MPDLTPTSLLRRDGVALWRQIEQALEREIAGGVHAEGAQLPTEAQLSARFGVNRHTVRRAMEELSRRGLIRIEQGRGSFVAEDLIDYTIGPRTRFSEVIRKQNREPAGLVLRVGEVAADQRMAEELGIRRGAKLIMVERLASADGRPICIGTHYFPASRFAALPRLMQEGHGITAALAAIGVTDYLRKMTRVTARMPTPEEADLLAQPRSRPILVGESINVDTAGVPVEWGMTRYATARVQIVFEP